MLIVSVVGAYDREAIQAFLNPLISTGGVEEVRLLQMGSSAYFADLVTELKLVHDLQAINAVNIKELLLKDEKSPEVLVFMNTSYKSYEDFCNIAFPLMKIIFDEIVSLEFGRMNILFGDNNRGLAQHAYLVKLMKEHAFDPTKLEIAVISSMFEMSKILNTSASAAYFRCYPKVDGGIFVYEASGKASSEEEINLIEEVKEQVDQIEKIFTLKSASSYPNIEGTTFFRFLSTYIQNDDWDISLRNMGLASRIPNQEEMGVYGLDSDVVVFLPPDGAERLPSDVKKHLQEASAFIASKIRGTEDAI